MRFCELLAVPRARPFLVGLCGGGLLVSAGCSPDEMHAPKPAINATVAPTNGLVGEWKLDETGGAIAADTKNGYDATVLGGAVFAPGKIGNGLSLTNGTAGTGGKYAEMPSNATLDNVQEGDYTISAWFNPYTVPVNTVPANHIYAIVVKAGWHMGLVYMYDGTFSMRHYLTGPSLVTANSTASYPINAWYHLAGVVSQAAGTVTLYVNGAAVGSTPFTAGTLAFEYGTAPFRIGKGSSDWAADGRVDQVRIYNRALTAVEVSDLYGETTGDITPPTISSIGSAPAWDKAAVMWKTNEASNSSVDYGLTSGYGSTTPVQSSLVTNHTVLITGLNPQTVYHYRVRSRDAAGNTAIGTDRTFATSPSGTLAAFPGAQGSGATSAGGRGGTIMVVDHLTDDAAQGSLRACMTATGTRTCVFRTGGTITLQTPILVTHGNLTVAGQTAPGGGILIKGKNLLSGQNPVSIRAPDVVIQYLRIRSGFNADRQPPAGTGGVPFSARDNTVRLMADHLSLSWNHDDNLDVWDTPTAGGEEHDISIAHVLIAEGLRGHSTAMVTGSQNNDASARLMTNIDLHHSMTANHNHRSPHLKNGSSRLVNNIFYNNSMSYTQLKGGINVDLIGNVYKKGTYEPYSTNQHEINAYTNTSTGGNAVIGSPSIYLLGNKGWNQTSPTGDQWLLANQTPDNGDNGKEMGPIPSGWHRGSPLAVAGVPIVVDDANNLESILTGSKGVGASASLDCNGNWVANRDAVDTRIMNQYANGTGTYPDSTTNWEVGAPFGWPTIASGTPCADADIDGMADAWETANGLDPNNAADRNTAAANGSGYTNLDMYLAGLPAR